MKGGGGQHKTLYRLVNIWLHNHLTLSLSVVNLYLISRLCECRSPAASLSFLSFFVYVDHPDKLFFIYLSSPNRSFLFISATNIFLLTDTVQKQNIDVTRWRKIAGRGVTVDQHISKLLLLDELTQIIDEAAKDSQIKNCHLLINQLKCWLLTLSR